MFKKIAQTIFCFGLVLSLFPAQAFAQEPQPVLEIQDQKNEEEKDETVLEEEKILEEEPEVLEKEPTILEEEPVVSEEETTSPEEQAPSLEEEATLPKEEALTPMEEEKPLPEIIDLPQEEIVDLPQEEPIEELPSSIEAPDYIPVLGQEYEDKGYEGSVDGAILYDNFVTKNYKKFLHEDNPFVVGQCTWFAWTRFYQVYGFDSGARGNGKTNAMEIVKAHGDVFELSSTPAAGSVYSMEKNTLYPECGHTGFIEAFDGEYVWISEGNVKFGDSEGNIWIHKVKWQDFKKQFPDVVFAVPKVDNKVKERFMDVHKTFFFLLF